MPGTYQIFNENPEAVPLTGYGLGRHVHHDPLSRQFVHPRRATNTTLTAVYHPRVVPVFDQGDLGSCVGNAALGILGTEPFYSALLAAGLIDYATGLFPFTEEGAVALYSAVTQVDPFDGAWPPQDTGSDGLSAAKALTARGLVPGYRHTFAPGDALAALMDVPLLIGTLWTDSMFYPNRRGLVSVGDLSYAVGGHEYIADQYDPANGWIGCTTSWGTSFGRQGRFYLTVDDFARLLEQDGDVIALELPGAQAPTPNAPDAPAVTADAADRALAEAVAVWLQAKGL